MRKLQHAITSLIDLFYIPPIRSFLPLQTFRYAVCGSANVVLSWVLYFVTFHYVLQKSDLSFGFVTISSHIASLVIVFPITFFTGFLLNKYITFRLSPLRGRTQLIRYSLAVTGSLFLNYALMKIFVDAFGFFPTPSQILSTVFVTIYSYLIQKYFSFSGCGDE